MSLEINAIKFRQWLKEWNDYKFGEPHRRRPDEHAYLFALSATQLRALSGVYRRKREGEAGEGLQRQHDQKRSATIRDFVRFGHPFSGLGPALRNENTESLKQPGWLPTAIVVNVLTSDDDRRGRKVANADLITIEDGKGAAATLKLPYDDPEEQWTPSALEPLEVIDGQHRLWAFDEAINDGRLPPDFELPVVAFRGLDLGWQAYLFWSINISPKRINPSHAFDLFPLLRTEAWLEPLNEAKIYREARAQELVELLFAVEGSPWHRRINMLGDRKVDAPEFAGVTQAGWARALMSTFLSPGTGRSVDGLFGAPLSPAEGHLNWLRAQQAALIILLWRAIEAAIDASQGWAAALLDEYEDQLLQTGLNPPFNGTRTMLNQEQGVRGVLSVANDLLYLLAKQDPDLFEMPRPVEIPSSTMPEDVIAAMGEITGRDLGQVVMELGSALASFDWRSADAKSLTAEEQLIRRAFRGSGGYVALRQQLMLHLASAGGLIGKLASSVVPEAPAAAR